jgi:hypothetical protein
VKEEMKDEKKLQQKHKIKKVELSHSKLIVSRKQLNLK